MRFLLRRRDSRSKNSNYPQDCPDFSWLDPHILSSIIGSSIIGSIIGLCLLGACGDDSGPAVPDAATGADAAPFIDAAAGDAADPGGPIFDLDVLHEIEITVDPMYLDALENDREARVPCTFVFDGVAVENVGVRQKGGIGSVSTLAGKPGLSVKIDEFVAGQRLHGEKKLVLNNALQDPSFLHEHLGYEVYRRAGVPAKRTSHGVVTLNGFTYGFYVINEAVDKTFLRRHFGEGNDEGNLYEGECCADFVTAPENVLLKDEVEEMRSRADLLALADTVLTAPDATFPAAVGARLDLDGMITSYAIDAIFIHWDDYAFNTNNYYLYHDPVSDRLVMLPHGMDQLLRGDDYDALRPPAQHGVWPNGRLAQRVREIPTLDQQYYDESYRVIDDAWDVPALEARIDRVATVLRSTTRTDERTVSDLASFDAWEQSTRDALQIRKDRYLQHETAVCGDGAATGFERCDDGNLIAGDGCDASCWYEGCGDGIVQPGLGEVCDGPDCLPDCSAFAVCDPYLAPGGDTFLVCSFVRSYWEAAADCVTRGGALATPADTAENDVLVASAFAVAANLSYWIGLDDELVEGDWRDFAGAPATWFAWAPGQPDGGVGDNCALVDHELSGGWNDQYCAIPRGYVCRLP